MNISFTKTHTQIAKGLAILMMLYHHLYIIPEHISCEYFSLFDSIIPHAQITIAVFCKLCVCIYAFLSGFGLFFQLKNKSLADKYKVVGIRAVKFMLIFVVIFLLFVPIGYGTGHFKWEWKFFVGAFAGLNLGVFNNTWWFVNAYLILLCVSPLFVYFFEKRALVKRCVVLSIYPIVYCLGRLYIHFFGTNVILDNYFWQLENYPLILSLFMGVFCARFNIYGRIVALFDKVPNLRCRRWLCLFTMFVILIGSIAFRVLAVRNIVDMRFDYLVAPLFVFSSCSIIYELKLNKVFVFCGNHSTNMWLTHAFLCYTYCQPLVFLPYYSEVVFVWFVVLSIMTSYLVNLVLVPLNNKLFSPFHKWSYRGFCCWPKSA